VRPSRLQRLALWAFPARFRARYGEELVALLPECSGGLKVTADLALAAAHEWLRPSFSGSPEERRRLRLQTTTATVFVLWSLSTLAAVIFARAVDDRPVPGLHAWSWVAYEIGSGVIQLTAGLVLLAGFGYWLRVVISAWRSRERSTLISAVLPVIVGGVWLAVTGLVAFLGNHIVPGNYRHISAQAPTTAGGMAVLAIYVLFTTGCVWVCAACAVRALAQSNLSNRLLAGSTLLAALVASALIVVAVAATVCLVRVLIFGGLDVRNAAMAVGAVTIFLLTSCAAGTSTLRGVRALMPAAVGAD
jgi:hypothetical protein